MAVTVPVTVGEMRPGDIHAVHEIERLSFRTPWPAHAFEQEIRRNSLARYLVARAGERVVAFAGVWMMADEAHITTFSVHPDWRRRGIGRQLLVSLADLSHALRASRMTLEVRAGNTAAQALYRSFGFADAGTRPRYYTDDGEDALIMTTPELGSPSMRAIIEAERARWAPGT